ncbi:MAG: hypothetical protein AAGD05_15425, partial [Bacteroidota bacterium]
MNIFYRHLFLVVCLFGCSCGQSAWAQKEGNIWYFGDQAGVNFNQGNGVIDTDNNIVTFEGCASISDTAGNLLFYTNGGGRDPLATGQDGG